MRNLFRILILISFVMSLSSCELFDPKLWAEVRERQEAAITGSPPEIPPPSVQVAPIGKRAA